MLSWMSKNGSIGKMIESIIKPTSILAFSTNATVLAPHLEPKSPRLIQQMPPVCSTSLSPGKAFPHLLGKPYLMQPIPYHHDNKVIYEISLAVDEDIVDDYLEWLRSGHIQETLALPGFESWELSTLERDEIKTKDSKGPSKKFFVERYYMSSQEALDEYFDKHASHIRSDHVRMWGGKVDATRAILHPIGKQSDQDALLWKGREESNSFRINNLEKQVEKMPKWTSKGFFVQKAPSGLWSKIESFYEDNKHKAELEQLNPLEVSINTWMAPTYKLEYPPELASEILDTIRPILEQWTGIPHLESTGISGLRFYQPGALIAQHVDLANTSVISALIHVDSKVEGPWPFEIMDHAGKGYELHLEPGDMIIYESASCAHARKMPLNGDYYCNTFMRFRPVGWTWSYAE